MEHQYATYDIQLRGLEDKINNMSTSTTVLFDNSNALNYKVQTTISQVMNSLSNFQEHFYENCSKLSSSNMDIWNEIKAIHLKSELNLKFINSIKSSVTDHVSEFSL